MAAALTPRGPALPAPRSAGTEAAGSGPLGPDEGVRSRPGVRAAEPWYAVAGVVASGVWTVTVLSTGTAHAGVTLVLGGSLPT